MPTLVSFSTGGLARSAMRGLGTGILLTFPGPVVALTPTPPSGVRGGMRWLCAGSGRPNRALLPSPEKKEERHQLKDP